MLSDLTLLPPPSTHERWRLHHQARFLVDSDADATLTCAGRRWRLAGLRPEVRAWLAGLTAWPQPLPVPDGDQAHRLADWLTAEGLVTRQNLALTTLVSRGTSQLRAPLARRIDLDWAPLPQPDDLALHAGLLVIEDATHDRTMSWLAQRSGVPHVVAELTPDGCRVGSFLAGLGCVRCADLRMAGNRPLVAHQLSARGFHRPQVPAWMGDWAANQVVLAVRRWRSGTDLAPGWWTLDAHGQVEHREVPAHQACCAAGRALTSEGPVAA